MSCHVQNGTVGKIVRSTRNGAENQSNAAESVGATSDRNRTSASAGPTVSARAVHQPSTRTNVESTYATRRSRSPALIQGRSLVGAPSRKPHRSTLLLQEAESHLTIVGSDGGRSSLTWKPLSLTVPRATACGGLRQKRARAAALRRVKSRAFGQLDAGKPAPMHGCRRAQSVTRQPMSGSDVPIS